MYVWDTDGVIFFIGSVFEDDQTTAKTALHYRMEKHNNASMQVAFDSYDRTRDQANSLLVTKDGMTSFPIIAVI